MPFTAPVLPFTTASAHTATAFDAVRGAAVGVGTLGLVLVLALVVGLTLLFRRRSPVSAAAASRLAPSNATLGIDELTLQAGATLVRADDAVESAENEVGFALAQFGPDRTRAFAEAVSGARAQVVEAFRLKQQLDDAHPDTDQQRRDWTKQVIALGESAARVIDQHTQQFTALRRSEADSPARLRAIRSSIDETNAAMPTHEALLQRLVAQYDPELLEHVRHSVDAAQQALGEASARALRVAEAIEPGGVTAVSAELEAAAALVHEARQHLAGLDETAASLAQADTALAELVVATRADLAEARPARDSAPDADSGARVLRAIDEVEFVLDVTTTPSSPSSSSSPSNPVHNLARLGSAVSTLDTALAGVRNQQQRLSHARTALVGALVAARSEIGVAKTAITSTRAGVDARTRLAEAERQLLLAESESDPVDALDAARRAASAARDADALARYRG